MAYEIASPLSQQVLQMRRLRGESLRSFQNNPVGIRFWVRVQRRGDDECWPWLGGKRRFGHGKFFVSGKKRILAHRFSWEWHFGSIPAGGVIRHRCDNPPCVNPAHLMLGTQFDNVVDRVVRGRSAIGERNGQAKLTVHAVKEIRVSVETTAALARRYGVGWDAVKNARIGQFWAHVPMDPK